MRERTWPYVLALAAVLTACDKAGKLREALQNTPLFQEVGAAARSGSCLRLVKANFGHMLPLPVIERGQGLFLVGFYPLKGDAGAETLATPEFAATFPPGRGQDAMCRFLTIRKSEDLGPRVAPGSVVIANLEAQRAYYTLVESVAPAFFEGREASVSEKLSAKELLAAFHGAAEPGLQSDYYRLSPDFWEWLRKQTGASLPKA